jgi:hypothetical protein
LAVVGADAIDIRLDDFLASDLPRSNSAMNVVDARFFKPKLPLR